jgi:hypothetical protein
MAGGGRRQRHVELARRQAGVTHTFDGGWSLSGAVTRAWGATDAYDHYALGIPNAAGQFDTSNPAAATFVLAVSKTF